MYFLIIQGLYGYASSLCFIHYAMHHSLRQPAYIQLRLLISHLSGLLLLSCRRRHHIFDGFQTSKIQPTAQKHHSKVETTEGPKDPKIQPFVIIIHIKPLREFITVGILAELAESISTILHISTGLSNEGLSVGGAGLVGRRSEASEFVGGANDGAAVDGDGEEAFEKVGEWG